MSKIDRPDTKIRGWKDKYRALGYKGFKWGGWQEDKKLHFFQRGDYSIGFEVVECRDSELFDNSEKDGRSSFQMLVDFGMTR